MDGPIFRYVKPPQLPGVELFQCRDADFSMPAHTHDGHVFWVNAAGGEKVDICGQREIMQPGTFGVVAPGEVHSNCGVGKKRALLSLYVDDSALKYLSRQMELPDDRVHFVSSIHQDEYIKDLLCQLHGVLFAGTDSMLAHETLLLTLHALIRRHGERCPDTSRHLSESGRVRRAMEMMREELGAPLGLNDLADECGCTAFHLIRMFRKEVGITPHSCLMNFRLGRAKQLLGTGVSVAQVAIQTGFSDQSHLTRRFKARFGVTPGQYQQQICVVDVNLVQDERSVVC